MTVKGYQISFHKGKEPGFWAKEHEEYRRTRKTRTYPLLKLLLGQRRDGAMANAAISWHCRKPVAGDTSSQQHSL